MAETFFMIATGLLIVAIVGTIIGLLIYYSRKNRGDEDNTKPNTDPDNKSLTFGDSNQVCPPCYQDCSSCPAVPCLDNFLPTDTGDDKFFGYGCTGDNCSISTIANYSVSNGNIIKTSPADSSNVCAIDCSKTANCKASEFHSGSCTLKDIPTFPKFEFIDSAGTITSIQQTSIPIRTTTECAGGGDCTDTVSFVQIDGKSITGNVLGSNTVASDDECAQRCKQNNRCTAYELDTATEGAPKTCILKSQSAVNAILTDKPETSSFIRTKHL
jgi:hypothetical protein